jgi:hypothetical protein
LFASQPHGAEAMNFRTAAAANLAGCRGDCGLAIVADGEITNETPAQFLDFLRSNRSSHPGRTVVFIESQGGKILGGIELGKIFRRIGATAVVGRIARAEDGSPEISGGVCFSACVYAFMGAKKRIAPSDSELGIHRMFAYLDGARHFADSEMNAMLQRYSGAMGVSPALVAAAEQITPDSVRILTPAEMARWRLASPGS